MATPEMTTPGTSAELRDLAVAIAREAGQLLTERRPEDRRPEDLAVDTKSTPTDPVTVMDKASEQLITTRLAAARPDDGLLGEEGASRPGTSGVRWIIDPLDGTVNYLYGLRTFSVSIAAEYDGTVVAGAVFDARTGSVHEAVRGGGARTLRAATGRAATDPAATDRAATDPAATGRAATDPAATDPAATGGAPTGSTALHCTTASDLAAALIGTGFSYSAEGRARQGRILAELLPQINDIRRAGSAALDLCKVAGGNLDGFFERELHPWDRAAGLLIAEEAGARVAVLPDGDSDITVAAAPGVFDALLAELDRLR